MHRHAQAYAALILEGGYDEFGLDGRYACAAGDVVLHPRFHAHGNHFSQGRADVLDIPLPGDAADQRGLVVLAGVDLEVLLHLARTDPKAAGHALIEESTGREALEPPGWLDSFLSRVLAGRSVAWSAAQAQVSPEHASRTCKDWYGLPPLALRREARIREAIRALRSGVPICEAADIAGFSDQPHFTRVLRAQTGFTPSRICCV